MTSAKRHRSLIPLSREHHYGLVICLRIRAGVADHREDPGWLRRKVADTIRFFERDLLPHFKAEEDVLFPAMSEFARGGDVIDRLRKEHDEISNRIRWLRAAASEDAAERLLAFAKILDAHIREEERTLFPLYEEQVTSKVAECVERGLVERIGTAEKPREPELLL